MQFRTKVNVEKPGFEIEPCEEMLFVGSCFADNMGRRFREEKFRATVNPYGVMYNPASILHTVERCADAPRVALFTLGTNHVYILNETGEIVDNCAKRPQRLFTERELTVDECVGYLRKAVDVLAISPDEDTLWMIEVKDFRANRRKKTKELYEEIWEKVFASLAALLPAQANATNTDEEKFAEDALCASHIRVAFHGEQPARHSKLFPQSYNPADLQKKFKSLFKAIDPHALVVNSNMMPASIPWTVNL